MDRGDRERIDDREWARETEADEGRMLKVVMVLASVLVVGVVQAEDPSAAEKNGWTEKRTAVHKLGCEIVVLKSGRSLEFAEAQCRCFVKVHEVRFTYDWTKDGKPATKQENAIMESMAMKCFLEAMKEQQAASEEKPTESEPAAI